MSTELGWAYDVLGVKPGVSDGELKTAHRDLAKVWHPDRFLHDPRLQDKAQEKLKEINEAYEQLISRHKRRVPPPPPRPTSHRAQTVPLEVVVPQRRGGSWHWYVAAALAVFAVVFALTTQKLVRDRERALQTTEVEESVVEPAADTRQEPTHTVRNRTENDSAPATEAVSETSAPANESTPAVPTVTVVIDPGNGLLATPSCPVKSRMTYPSGSEPRGHCNITHIVKPEKEFGIKGFAKRIL
ncbi:MAG: DnaJ domain-containing protein [Acidobacteria bacterium]|nr:DnaJ domain-containing protein [Acidobacteriota bacterium]